MSGREYTNQNFLIGLNENALFYDPGTSSQMQLHGNVHLGGNVDGGANFGNNAHGLNWPNENSRVAHDMERHQQQHSLQIPFNNIFQNEVDNSRIFTHQIAAPIGLPHNPSVMSAVGPSCFGDNLRFEFDRHTEELDNFLRSQERETVKGLRKLRRKHINSLIQAAEKELQRKLQEKDLEIERVNRSSMELQGKLMKISQETQAWQEQVQWLDILKDSTIREIQQLQQQLEGFGENEVASSSDPNACSSGDLEIPCKYCMSKEACMILLQCKHLCLCENCVKFIKVCPICQCTIYSYFRVEFG